MRPEPSTRLGPIGVLARGVAVTFKRIELNGERVGGDGRWGELASGGYLSLTTLQAAT